MDGAYMASNEDVVHSWDESVRGCSEMEMFLCGLQEKRCI